MTDMNDMAQTAETVRIPVTEPSPHPGVPGTIPLSAELPSLTGALRKSVAFMRTLQRTDGYWWFALEANESIGAEFIFLMHYLGDVDAEIQAGICRRILDVQRIDGTWSLYFDGPPDLSTTVECYLALKMAGFSADHPALRIAREYIIMNGGIEKTRVFTKIHLAMFGIVPWKAAPAMPAEFVLLPKWFPFTIYSFSSWARATIVPLLVFMSHKKVCELPAYARIDELFVTPAENRKYSVTHDKGLISWESFFIILDKCLKLYERFPLKALRKYSIKKCSEWIWEHVSKTEDIYPALAYGALAYKAMGYENDTPQIRRSFGALKMFQQRYASLDVPALPDEIRDDGRSRPSAMRDLGIDPRVPACHCEERSDAAIPLSQGDCFDLRSRNDTQDSTNPESRVPSPGSSAIHQQCCISPVWDTPWMVTAMLESGVASNDPALLHAGRWLLRKQITECRGDWAVRNPKGKPGGWSFEFENDYFPDVDDTIQVLSVLSRLAIPWKEKANAFQLGLDWLLSMQNDDGGWGAFDRNQTQLLVNRIPFSDHGACLDPSSPDITGRMIEFLVSRNFSPSHPAVRRALDYIWRTQEGFGGWYARWGVNYIYGTWCVLTALGAAGLANDPRATKAAEWLASVQRTDGGYSESPETYKTRKFTALDESIPSQTAWALMGLVAAGLADSQAASMAARWLIKRQNGDGAWDERHYTGTGFPNHFYIRYHGYRHFFPLLALARYSKSTGDRSSATF